MKTITIPVLLRFDSCGAVSVADQAKLALELVNGAVSEVGFNSNPVVLPAPLESAAIQALRNLTEWVRTASNGECDQQAEVVAARAILIKHDETHS